MAEKDFELVLRVQADLQNAVKELRGLNDNMRVTKTSAQQASSGIAQLDRSTKSAVTGISNVDARLKAMGSTVNAAAGHLKLLAGAIGVAFVVHKVADFTRSLIDANEQLFQLAKQAEGLNVSVKFFSGLTQQADDFGVGVQQIAVAMGTLNRQLATAKRGSATAKGMFELFGIDPDEINSTEDAFLGVADSVAKYGLNAQRAGVLTQIFGTSGKDIVPILKQGAAAIREQNDAMAKTGQIITDDQVPAIVQLHNATDQIGDSFTALRNNLIIQLAPSISQIADQFNEFVTTHGPELERTIVGLVAKLPQLARGFGEVATGLINATAKLADFIHAGQQILGFSLDGNISGDTGYSLALAQLASDKAELARRQNESAVGGALRRDSSDALTFLKNTPQGITVQLLMGKNPLGDSLGDADLVRSSAKSTEDLQKEIARLEADTAAYRRQTTQASNRNPQEGDTRGLFAGLPKPGTGARGAADPAAAQRALAIAKQAASAQADLTQALITLQGQLDPTAAAWAQYNAAVTKANASAERAKHAPGADPAAIDAQRDAVIALHAAVRDAKLDAIAEKDRQAWEALKRSFEAPAQVAVDDALKKIAQLNDLLNKGVISSADYHNALAKIGTSSVTAAPDYQGPDAAVSGAFGDLQRNSQALDALEAWHQSVLAANARFHSQNEQEEDAYQARMAAIEQTYSTKRVKIEQARGVLMLQASQEAFGQLAALTNSSNRQLAVLGRAAAIVQAGLSLAINVAKASEVGFPYNIPFIAGAIAQGAEIVSLIDNAGSGYSEGGFTGPGGKYQVAGVVHAGEGVLSQSDIAAMGGRAGFEALRAGLRGYATGGFVAPPHPLANASRLGALGFANPMRLPVSAAADSSVAAIAGMGSGQGGGDQTHIHVWSTEQAAEELAKVPSFQKAVVHIVGENPMAIRGKWRS